VTANLPAVAADRGTGTIIEARDLVLSFGETPALRGASLTVRRGEMTAVMGPSGSGKSTLLHCLAGILVPDEGEVRFADEPTGSLDSVSGEPVTDLLTDVARERGTTVVLVTHDARVAAYAGREGVVRDGAISTLTGARP
jgi:putative ABC transport system ATP-binding protein